MELQEHLDESPELREWYEAMTVEMDRLTATGFPHIVPGVMDADAGITHRAYLEEIEELVTRRIWNTGTARKRDGAHRVLILHV